MRPDKSCIVTVVMALVSGCVFDRQVVLDTAVGPPRLLAENRAAEGGLVVYSAFDEGSEDGDYERIHHSDYKLCTFEGQSLKHVSNKVSTIIEDPATVSLPPGKYKVIAKAAGFGMVTVPVVIEAGKTTAVHLDGSELGLGRQFSTNGFVRLPDGLIIGWRADQSHEANRDP